MKKLSIALLALTLVFVASPPSYARGGHGGGRAGGAHAAVGHAAVGHADRFHHGHSHGRGHFHRGHVFVGAGVGDPFWDPFWWGPPPLPPLVVETPPVMYIQRQPANEAPQPGYWYYCRSAGAYWPTARGCSEGWVKVTPQS